jgi:hypothetical protein
MIENFKLHVFRKQSSVFQRHIHTTCQLIIGFTIALRLCPLQIFSLIVSTT